MNEDLKDRKVGNKRIGNERIKEYIDEGWENNEENRKDG